MQNQYNHSQIEIDFEVEKSYVKIKSLKWKLLIENWEKKLTNV